MWTRTHQDCPDVGVLCVVCAVLFVIVLVLGIVIVIMSVIVIVIVTVNVCCECVLRVLFCMDSCVCPVSQVLYVAHVLLCGLCVECVVVRVVFRVPCVFCVVYDVLRVSCVRGAESPSITDPNLHNELFRRRRHYPVVPFDTMIRSCCRQSCATRCGKCGESALPVRNE